MRCALAAADAPRGAVQTEVPKPHVQQESETGTYLFQRGLGNGGLPFRELRLDLLQKVREFMQVHAAELANVFAAKLELKADGFQACTVTGGAGHLVHERLRPSAKGNGFRFFCRPNNGRHQPFKRDRAAANASFVLEFDVAVGAVQNLAHDLLRNLAHGRRQRQAVLGQNGFHDA